MDTDENFTTFVDKLEEWKRNPDFLEINGHELDTSTIDAAIELVRKLRKEINIDSKLNFCGNGKILINIGKNKKYEVLDNVVKFTCS